MQQVGKDFHKVKILLRFEIDDRKIFNTEVIEYEPTAQKKIS